MQDREVRGCIYTEEEEEEGGKASVRSLERVCLWVRGDM